MSNYFIGTISHGTTGTKTIAVGFQAKGMRITLGSKFNNTDLVDHKSVGWSDGNLQFFHSNFSDSWSQTRSGSDKIVSHYERVSPTSVVETVAAHIDNAVAPWTATQVKYIVDTANSNYQFFLEVWD